MDPKSPRGKRPEALVQDAVIKLLRNYGWYVKVMIGNAFQSGVPDLFATHSRYGARWIEIKLPNMKGSRFTAAQLEEYPKLCANGSGVWILTSDSDEEYQKLFKKFNWYLYLDVMK